MNRLRGKLTAFNTAITGAILVGMTVLCLFLSEQNTRAAARQNFSDTLNTVSTYLSGQSQISVAWLRRMENTGRVSIFIRDGGVPLFSMGFSRQEPTAEAERAYSWAEENRLLNQKNAGSWIVPQDTVQGNCLAGLALIPKDGHALELVLLYPLEQLESTVRRQRLAMGLAALLAICLLGLFSWYFTGRLLRPIQENQQRQYEFTAAAAHELRTPLAAILSAASAWERAECVPGESQAMFSDVIRREGKRMTRLISDLLTLAAADCRSWELRFQNVELDMLLLKAYEDYLPLSREKGLRLSLELPETDGFPAHGDGERLMQVVTILLDNAMEYTPAPGSVQLLLRYGRSSARITVADSGPGVPEGQRQRIFDRFHRVEKARAGQSHFGLGLSIAAEIVRLHRGKIWVEAGRNGGAVFCVELPRPFSRSEEQTGVTATRQKPPAAV